jgi:hypothetical protein
MGAARRFLDNARRGLAGGAWSRFATMWSPAYRVYAVVPPLDATSAERAVAAEFAPPDGFRVDYRARPADLREFMASPADLSEVTSE